MRYKYILTDDASALHLIKKFLKIFWKIFSWLLIKVLFSYLDPPHWFSFLSDNGVTFVFCCSEDVIKSKILNERSKRRCLCLVYCIALLKHLVKLTEQHLQGSPIVVKLLAHTCSFRKIRHHYRCFSWVSRNFSEQLFNIQQLWTIAPEDVDWVTAVMILKLRIQRFHRSCLRRFPKWNS